MKQSNNNHHQMREEEIKPKNPQVMHSTIAHLPLTDAKPIPEQ